MFGNVATLLGLLGTISGMIISFASVASANPAERATLLSAGISEAMNCTAFGLLVAIPALVAYAVFQNRTDRVVTELTQETSRIFHDLLFLSETPKSKVTEKVSATSGLLNPSPVGA
jgi:biopolymer transport protein ExbB/TolQ